MESPASTSLPSGDLWIGGRWVPTSARIPILSPATGQLVGNCGQGTREHLELAVAAAQRSFEMTRRQAAFERAGVLLRIAGEIERRQGDFCQLIVGEAGKPLALAEAEVKRAVITFTAAAEEARRSPGEVLSLDAFAPGKGYQGWTRRFPIGLVYGITPFNFPLNLVAHKVAPCLATGNSLILKPAPKTPLTALLLAEVLDQAGVPPGQVNVVTCPNEEAGYLVGDRRVAMTSFTGSPEVGWKIKDRSGQQKVVLELGGNAPVIVHEDADLDLAIPAIASGGFSNAGQSCISVQRILVHAPILPAFRERLVTYVKQSVILGDPSDRRTVVGPMIDRRAVDRALDLLRGAVSAGATVLVGGQAEGNFLEPTIVEGVTSSMALCAREAFAPIVTLQPYESFDQALALANDSIFGLQAGVFTRDLGRALRAFETLEVGGVMINQVPTFRLENMPYGGIKESGFGREGVRYAMEEMTESRSILIRNG